ncbi:hypothetical protein [Chitinophaga sp.]|uniref:hypothetical protein n=1 Tax=Chitinophaga sp. TaxID=1869181 RepID=UPI002F93BCE1
MNENVNTFLQALDAGYEPREYLYEAHYLPIGDVCALLDFKIWTKNAAGITCFLSENDTGKKFRLTVFRRKDNHEYKLDDGIVDFRNCPVGTLYHLVTEKNGSGNIMLRRATIASS